MPAGLVEQQDGHAFLVSARCRFIASVVRALLAERDGAGSFAIAEQ
jgi:hypothetical protein